MRKFAGLSISIHVYPSASIALALWLAPGQAQGTLRRADLVQSLYAHICCAHGDSSSNSRFLRAWVYRYGMIWLKWDDILAIHLGAYGLYTSNYIYIPMGSIWWDDMRWVNDDDLRREPGMIGNVGVSIPKEADFSVNYCNLPR